MFDSIRDWALAELREAKRAPVAFCIVALLFATLGWWGHQQFVAERIAVMEQRIAGLGDRLNLREADPPAASESWLTLGICLFAVAIAIGTSVSAFKNKYRVRALQEEMPRTVRPHRTPETGAPITSGPLEFRVPQPSPPPAPPPAEEPKSVPGGEFRLEPRERNRALYFWLWNEKVEDKRNYSILIRGAEYYSPQLEGGRGGFVPWREVSGRDITLKVNGSDNSGVLVYDRPRLFEFIRHDGTLLVDPIAHKLRPTKHRFKIEFRWEGYASAWWVEIEVKRGNGERLVASFVDASPLVPVEK